MELELTESPLESRRFGTRIARLDLTGLEDPRDVIELVATSGFDLVIAKSPTGSPLHPGLLNEGIGCRVTLTEIDVTWWGSARPGGGEDAREVSIWDQSHTDLVLRIFHGYRNHMGRAPGIDGGLVAAGYAEWAARHVGRTGSACLTVGSGPLGLAAVSVTPGDPPAVTVDLAGVIPEARRKGVYSRLLDAVERWTLEVGCQKVRISTQADNIPVQRAWARRGWLPESSEWIAHLRPVGSAME